MATFEAIGSFHSSITETCQSPYQTGLLEKQTGYILLNKHCNFEQSLEDLATFDRLWVIFHFDRVEHWKPKVKTPRDPKKRGVLATRSPHRPNPIGLSAVKLCSIDGLKLHIEDHDLLDGTPILDIKPYLNYVDSFPDASRGWLENKDEKTHNLEFSDLVKNKLSYLQQKHQVDLLAGIECTLQIKPYPDKENRIKSLSEGLWEIAYKTWRFSFKIEGDKVFIDDLYGSYTEEYLSGKKESKWDDVPIHQEFIRRFSKK